jgi:hypothetical protein
MAYEDRSYSGNAVSTTLTANISNVATTIPIASSTGWPDGTGGPFHIGIAPANDPDNYVETIRCSSRTGLNLTVQTVPVNGRGWDGTTAAAHLTGAVVRHVATATDLEEANQHIVNTGLDHHGQYLTVGRHDLSARHGFGVLPTAGTPSTSVVGDTASSGASNNVARVDHKHAREVFGSPSPAGPVTSDGVATSVPRSDHHHAGGIPILTSGTRPASPIVAETFLESDTRRVIARGSSGYFRVANLAPIGRTGVVVGRANPMAVADGGPAPTPIPWDTEVADTDGFITVNGVNTSITPPSAETSGVFLMTFYGFWATLFTQRSFVEFLFDGTYHYRHTTTGEDYFSHTAMIDINTTQDVQVAIWQNSGAPVDLSFCYLSMFLIQP